MKAEFVAVFVKEFRQIFRDKRMLAMLVVAPVVQLLVFGFAVDYDVHEVRTAVCDADASEQSRSLVRALLADRTFVAAKHAPDCGRPEAEIRSGHAHTVLIIPHDYSHKVVRNEPVSIQFLVDGTNPVIGRYVRDAAGAFAQFYSKQSRVIAQPRVFFNPEMKSSIFIVPGVAAMILIVVTMLATSMGLARERETGVLEQIMVTPISVPVLLLGKVLPFVILGLFDILLVMVVSVWVFAIPVRGALALHGLGTLLFLLSTVGLGLFVSTISKTQQQAFMTGFLLLLPFVLLSGVMTPIASMPPWLRPLTFFNPIRYYVEILRGVLLKGSTFVDLWPSFTALFVFGLIILTMACLRFKKRWE